MHPLNDYVAKQLAERLKTRKVVIWYDPRGEFAPFISELRGRSRTDNEPAKVVVGGISALLAEYSGSMFELRALAEAHTGGDTPETMVFYLPGCERDREASVLMELEKAGDCYEPQLKRLARNVLRLRYTDGVIDEMLTPEWVSYEDLARASSDTNSTEPPSILKSIFHDAGGNDGLLAAWLVNDDRDADIGLKEASGELVKLIRSRLGLEPPEAASMAKLRSVTARYVLAGEFRSDFSGPSPKCLDGVATPKTKDQETALRDLARHLRASFPEAYTGLADRVEEELGLRNACLPADALGAIDTFRFEERLLLAYVSKLIANGRFDDAATLITGREHSFWLDRDVGRKAQWDACRRMAELGSVAITVRQNVSKTSGDVNTWIEAYIAKDGWYRLDQAQRQLEAWVANLDEEPDERAIGVVRRAYEDACRVMAEGFTKALVKAGWAAPTSLHQTRVFTEVVSDRPKPAKSGALRSPHSSSSLAAADFCISPCWT